MNVLAYDPEIVGLWNIIMGNQKKSMFNFRSNNTIKKNFFKKLVDRLIYFKEYTKKLNIPNEYEYFIGLLNIFLNAKKLWTGLINTSNIFLDINRALYKIFLDFLVSYYNLYTESFNKLLQKKNRKEFLQLNIYPQTESVKECQTWYTKFINIYKNKKIIYESLSNTSGDITEMNDTIEKLNDTIIRLNVKLIAAKEEEENNAKKRANRRKIQYNAAKKYQNSLKNSQIVNKKENWTSLFRRPNLGDNGESIPTDPRQIEIAKERFALLQKMKSLEIISKSCNTKNIQQPQNFTQEQYKECSNAARELEKYKEQATRGLKNNRNEHHWSKLI
jgi:hypothetical protein